MIFIMYTIPSKITNITLTSVINQFSKILYLPFCTMFGPKWLT